MSTALVSTPPSTSAEDHCQQGVALAEQGRLDEAIAHLHAALGLRPDYDKGHHNLGVAFAQKGQPEEAIHSLRQALALNPQYAEAHYNLGNVLLAQNKAAGARQIGSDSSGHISSRTLTSRSSDRDTPEPTDRGLVMDRLKTACGLLPAALCCCLGCLSDDAPTTLVSANPFGTKAPAPPPGYKAAYAAAPIEVATRVDSLGRKLLAANGQLGIRPLFTAGGDPKPEIFHKGAAEVVITTGLVNQCKTEGELAAILCAELGKMISEREALAAPAPKTPQRPPPLELRIGNDQGGIVGRQDEVYAVERAKLDRKAQTPPRLPPDPQVLARGYLTKAGYVATDLDAVAPLLKEADKNSTWEKAMKSNPGQEWKP